MYLPQSPSLSGAVVMIPDGTPGIHATLRAMRQLVRDYRTSVEIRGVALSLLALTPPKDATAEIVALFEFVRDRIRYVGDVLDVETLTTPDKTLALAAGDCDDKAVLLAALLESVGYITRFVVAGYNIPDVFEHVFVQAMLPDGCFISLDPTEDESAGFEPPNPVAYFVER
jgi:hypothetical protein